MTADAGDSLLSGDVPGPAGDARGTDVEAVRPLHAGGLAAGALPFAEEGEGALVKLVIAFAIFVLPSIVKAIRESRAKREAAQRGELPGPATSEHVEEPESADEDRGGKPPPGFELEEPMAGGASARGGEAAEGRAQWEQLLRGESAAPAPTATRVPPVPAPQVPPQVPRRTVLTETAPLTGSKALTEAEPLTAAPPLTAARVPERAIPHASYDTRPSYDETAAEARELAPGFDEFAAPEPLASDREGGPARRIGSEPSAAERGMSADIGQSAAISVLEAGEIGATPSAAHARRPGARARRAFGAGGLREAVIAAEVLGPPLALRPSEGGPTRPLGWT